MNRNFVFYFSFVLYMIVFIRLIASQADCFRRSSGGLEQFCCDNYVKRNGVCVECEAGSKSINEEPCTPCNQGTYGRKCNSLCKCKINERCDRVTGCSLGSILFTPNVITDRRNSLSTNKHIRENTNGYLQQTSTARRDISTTRFTKGTELTPHPTEKDHIIPLATFIQELQNETLANTITDTIDRKELFTKTEIIVYSVGSSSSILVIALLCFLLFCFYNNKRKDDKQGRISIQDSHEANEENGSVYDSINESEIYDDNIQIIYSEETTIALSRQTSDSEESSKESGCSGYLHPYTTVTKDVETHMYCTQITSYDSSSSSFTTDDMTRDSGYTHPYQQLEAIKSVESKSEYSNLVQYLELIDITRPSSVSKLLSNKTILPNLKLNDQKEYDVGVLCPVSTSQCLINRNNDPSCQSLDFRLHPVRYFSSFPTFDQRENNIVDNENVPHVKHMSF